MQGSNDVLVWAQTSLTTNRPKQSASARSVRVQVQADGGASNTVEVGPNDEVISRLSVLGLVPDGATKLHVRLTWYDADNGAGSTCGTRERTFMLGADGGAGAAPLSTEWGSMVLRENSRLSASNERLITHLITSAQQREASAERSAGRIEKLETLVDSLRAENSGRSSEKMDEAKADAIKVMVLKGGELFSAVRVWLAHKSLPTDEIERLRAMVRGPAGAMMMVHAMEAAGLSSKERQSFLDAFLDAEESLAKTAGDGGSTKKD